MSLTPRERFTARTTHRGISGGFLILLDDSPTMSRTRHTVLNWFVGFVVASLIARWVLGRDRVLKPAVIGGTVTGLIAWATYEKPAFLQDDSDATATAGPA